MWNYEGLVLTGKYLEEFVVEGVCETSRVAYGGRVKHTIVLKEPIDVYGAKRDRIILDHESVTRIRDNNTKAQCWIYRS